MIYMRMDPSKRKPIIKKPELQPTTPVPAPIGVKAYQVMEEPKLPSMTSMAGNLLKTAVNTVKTAVKGKSVSTSSLEANTRLAICQTCEYFRKSDQRCSKCGCFMAVKTYLKAEHCPVSKW